MEDKFFNVQPEQAYFFSFNTDLSTLNGVYIVKAIMVFDEVEMFLTDPVQDLYIAANKLEIYTSQGIKNKFRSDIFYKLQSSESSDVFYYVPNSLIISYPSSDFKEMLQYMLVCEIGIISDPKELEALVPLVNQVVWKNIGIDPITMISSYAKVHLSEQVIADHTKTRLLNKETVSVYTQLLQQQNEIAKLREKLGILEKIIVDYYKKSGGKIVPEKSPIPIISSATYDGSAFILKSTIWDTEFIHKTSQWQISKLTDFEVPTEINEVTPYQLILASFVKAGVTPGNYYARVRYGGVVGDGTDITNSEWSAVFSFTVS